MPEVGILYEKVLIDEMKKRADDIENTMAAIGGCFGGGKEIEKLVKSLREGGGVIGN